MKRTFLCLPSTIGFVLLLVLFVPTAASIPLDTGVIALGALLPAAQQPYPGPDPHPIPGKIEAENYDVGGEGAACHDTTPGNAGSEYRSDDVEIEITTDVDGGFNVGWIEE
ncbi:MAG: carbohydrate-binding protein, partial [Anaerolineae bacterium]